MIKGGHIHHKCINAPVGFVFFSLTNLGVGPIEAFGRTFYLADGNNGTTNLLAKFPRMNNSLNTGGSDTHTLTENEMPIHDHIMGNRDIYVSTGSSRAAHDNDNYPGSQTLHTKDSGGGAAHNNMPAYQEMYPYQAVS